MRSHNRVHVLDLVTRSGTRSVELAIFRAPNQLSNTLESEKRGGSRIGVIDLNSV